MINITHHIVQFYHPGILVASPNLFIWEALTEYSLYQVRASLIEAPSTSVVATLSQYNLLSGTTTEITPNKITLTSTEVVESNLGQLILTGDRLLFSIESTGVPNKGAGLTLSFDLLRI